MFSVVTFCQQKLKILNALLITDNSIHALLARTPKLMDSREPDLTLVANTTNRTAETSCMEVLKVARPETSDRC